MACLRRRKLRAISSSGRRDYARCGGEQPLFEQAGGCAVGLQMRCINHHRVHCLARACQRGEDAIEDANPAPANEAIVERLRRPVDGRGIPPSQPTPDDMNDAADDPTVIDPRHTARLVRQERLQPRELGLESQK